MSNKKQKDIYVDAFDQMLNGKKHTDSNLKKDILDNLEIANKMFDKYNNFIFSDNDLKVKAKELHSKLSLYSDLKR
ncbi:hypothetical protein [Clostridium baratii]|uniref:hypothetical protein n=1 Tax=Clostridium baratii TaxID=1561 RepID=UPI0006C4518A|nr:hypothetical protein [Clostridium baratii]MDU4910679.1 hypothetical protein [Clostridium baratii]CUO94561.1 Uncharacterised protein [Clostridium baratii]